MSTTSTEPFSHALRERTWELHGQAEGAGFMRALMNGDVDRDGYAAMVAQQLFVYEALEAAAVEMRGDPIVGPFADEKLTRVPALRADLADLLGPDRSYRIEPGSATSRYVARIHEVGTTWPGGFLAHHYTRYLGDLSGGQVIRRAVERHYGHAGVRFYVFDSIPSPKRFKDEYRAMLDALPWPADERGRVIDEVLLAYRLNTEVFADLSLSLGITTPA